MKKYKRLYKSDVHELLLGKEVIFYPDSDRTKIDIDEADKGVVTSFVDKVVFVKFSIHTPSVKVNVEDLIMEKSNERKMVPRFK